MESEYKRKYEEYLREAETAWNKYKIGMLVLGMLSFAFLIFIMMAEIKLKINAKWLILPFDITLLMMFVVYNRTVKKRRECNRYKIIVEDVEEFICEENLTDREIMELDEILENHERGICTYKTEDTLVTFTEKFIVVTIYCSDGEPSIEMCRADKVDTVKITDDLDGMVYFDFCQGEKCAAIVDINQNVIPVGREDMVGLIRSFYPKILMREELDR